MKTQQFKFLTRFSLLSMIMLITWLSCLLAPLIQRRDHVQFFNRLGGEGEKLKVGWHQMDTMFPNYKFELDRGHIQSPLANWFAKTPLNSLLNIGKDRTISDTVQSIDLKDVAIDQLARISPKLSNCLFLESLIIEGPIPTATAKDIGDCKPLVNLNVIDCDAPSQLCLNLKRLKNLQALSFKNCKLSQQDLDTICEINSLRFVCLVDSNVSGESVAQIRAAIPKCYVFQVEPDEGLLDLR